MNSIGHLVISIVKSLIRMFACIYAYMYHSVEALALGFVIAELLGILEELADKRK